MHRADGPVRKRKPKAQIILRTIRMFHTSDPFGLSRGIDQETQQINEVACFAYNAAAAHLTIPCPVVGRNFAGVHGDHYRFWPACASQKRFRFENMWREATIETNHQTWRKPGFDARLIRFLNCIAFSRMKSQWLL